MKPILAAAGVAAAILLAACAAVVPGAARVTTTETARQRGTATGTVIGSFVREGGPLGPGGTQPPSLPLAGVVTFTPPRGRPVTVMVARSGKFRVRLSVGEYRVAGRSPSIVEQLPSGLTRDVACSVPLIVSVAAKRTVRVVVVCAVP